MTDYTAKRILLKDMSGNYMIPYTDKQDILVSGTNIKSVEGNSILGGGDLSLGIGIKLYDSSATYTLNQVVLTVVSDSVLLYRSLANNNTSPLSDTTKWEEVELGGAIDIDGNTITLNSNDEIQTIGVIDSSNNATALKLWTGTRAEYDAITTKDANTLYNITDDTGDLGTFANTDLSNLSNVGEAHFANPDLSNLSTAGQAKFDAKANVSNTVTTDTAQTITGSKRFTTPSTGFSIELMADTNQQIVPTSDTINYLALYRNTTYTKGDGYTSWMQASRGPDGKTKTSLYARRFLEGDSQQILSYVSAEITADGVPVAYTKTPPAGVSSNEIVTAAWVRNMSLPSGTIIIFGGSTAPAGYLLCNGGAISRTTYANLFSAIGTIYGAGNGTTTFNLPNIKPNYGSTCPVRGDGNALGLTNGSTTGYLTSWRPGSAVSGTLALSTSRVLGNNQSTGYASGGTSAFGVVTNGALSGLYAQLNTHNNINYYIKY